MLLITGPALNRGGGRAYFGSLRLRRLAVTRNATSAASGYPLSNQDTDVDSWKGNVDNDHYFIVRTE